MAPSKQVGTPGSNSDKDIDYLYDQKPDGFDLSNIAEVLSQIQKKLDWRNLFSRSRLTRLLKYLVTGANGYVGRNFIENFILLKLKTFGWCVLIAVYLTWRFLLAQLLISERSKSSNLQ